MPATAPHSTLASRPAAERSCFSSTRTTTCIRERSSSLSGVRPRGREGAVPTRPRRRRRADHQFVPRARGPVRRWQCRPSPALDGRYEGTVTSGNAFSRYALNAILPMPEGRFRQGGDGYLCTLAPLFGSVRSIEERLGAYVVTKGTIQISQRSCSNESSGGSSTTQHDMRRSMRRQPSSVSMSIPTRTPRHLSPGEPDRLAVPRSREPSYAGGTRGSPSRSGAHGRPAGRGSPCAAAPYSRHGSCAQGCCRAQPLRTWPHGASSGRPVRLGPTASSLGSEPQRGDEVPFRRLPFTGIT